MGKREIFYILVKRLCVQCHFYNLDILLLRFLISIGWLRHFVKQHIHDIQLDGTSSISILSNILYTLQNWFNPGLIMQVTIKLLVKLKLNLGSVVITVVNN